ncbi:MAG TPA: efflux RND transporter periplasmic adaptor subunit [Gemmatimonadales bacterium]|nr:efflux RND transporter periplasmic adaptor subunit [Gemmatimonadales bacterium]
MSRRMKLGLVATILLAVVGGTIALAAAKRGQKAVEVRLEPVKTRDLAAVVTASGKIEAKTKVDILSDIQGRITRIAVREGDYVKKGDFLLQIDPAQYQAIVARARALLASAQSDLLRARANRDQAHRSLMRALELQKTNPSLITQEAVEQAQTAYDVAEANLRSSQATVEQARASLAEAQDNLRKTRLVAPISGRVTRLAVEEGEVAVPGTFSRDVGLLMTIADLSVILAKVQVDETDVVRLALGDSAEVTIDAFPDTAFTGRVTKISNSAVLTATATASGSTDRAVDFDVEIQLDHPPPDIRPDLSCTARIVTDIRKGALSIPIIALTVRENEPVPSELKPTPAADTGTAGRKKKETEGVFVVRGGTAYFRPVKVGIAGDEYFEVLEGVKEGDTIVAGTYQAIRDLKDSTRVKSSALADSAKGARR